MKVDRHLRNTSFTIRRCCKQTWETIFFNQKQRHGEKGTKSFCIAMTIYNLSNPAWIRIGCNTAIKTVLICMKTHQMNKVSDIDSSTEVFHKSCVLRNNTCYLFTWNNVKNTFYLRNIESVDIEFFEIMFHAISEAFPPIYFPKEQKILTYEKYGMELYFKESEIDKYTEYYVISKEKPKYYLQGGNLFQCSNNKYISFSYICDQYNDCQDDTVTDESNCVCKLIDSDHVTCKFKGTSDSNMDCSFFYSLKMDSTCQIYGELNALNNFHKGLVKNLNDKHIPCGDTSDTLYSVTDICTYSLNDSYKLIPCENGDHLQTCTDYECNMKFKCPMFYCIPWKYICDGKWDCPQGYDEITDFHCPAGQHCTNMFKCRNSVICIHLGDVCDGEDSCPFGDDEKFCLLNEVPCPKSCYCLTIAIKCLKEKSNRAIKNLPFHVVNLINCSRMFALEFLQKTSLLSVAIINHSHLDQLCFLFKYPHYFLTLDFGSNKVQIIKKNCFNQATLLHTIKLVHNNISYLFEKSFWNLPSLKHLDLSSNPLTKLEPDMIVGCQNIHFFFLNDIYLIQTNKKVFEAIRLKILNTTDHRLCCFIKYEAECTSTKPWYVSCDGLFLTIKVKICHSCISITIISLNLIKFFLQGFSKLSPFKIITISINMIDFSYGLYMVLILMADQFFNYKFPVDDMKWRSSFMCFLSFSLALNLVFFHP